MTSLIAALVLVAVAADSAYAWSWPVTGEVLRPFVFADDPYGGGLHRGVDIAGEAGEAVVAPAGGRVAFAGTVPGSGRTVTIQTADGFSVTLVHLGAVTVERGDLVAEGTAVGVVGTSGDAEWPRPYVHLGVRVTADPHGYVDPLTLLPSRTPAIGPGSPPVPTATSVPVAPPVSPTVLPPPAPAALQPAAPVVQPKAPATPVVPAGRAGARSAPSSSVGTAERPAATGAPAPASASGRPPAPPASPTALPAPAVGAAAQAPPAAETAPAAATAPEGGGEVVSPPAPAASGTGTTAVPATAEPAPASAAAPVDPLAAAQIGVPTPSTNRDAPLELPRTTGARRRVPAAGGRRGYRSSAVSPPVVVRDVRRTPSRARARDGGAPGQSVGSTGGSARNRAGLTEHVAGVGKRDVLSRGSTLGRVDEADVPSAAAWLFLPVFAALLVPALALGSRRRPGRPRIGVQAVGPERGTAAVSVDIPLGVVAGCPGRRPAAGGSRAVCRRVPAGDPLAALLAPPRRRPAPPPAFRGRRGRAVAASHRARQAGLVAAR